MPRASDNAASDAGSGRRRWLILAAALVLLALLWWGLDARRRNEVLELPIKSGQGAVTEFRIPRNYFEPLFEPDGGRQERLWLRVYLPDLLPQDAAEKAGYQTSVVAGGGLKLSSDNEVEIWVGPSAPGSVAGAFRYITSEREIRYDGVRPGGLEVYTITKRNYSGNYLPDPSRGEYLRPPGRDDVYIECADLDAKPTDRKCDIHTQLSDKLEVRFSLTRSRLAEWASVEAKVRKLIASFVVEGQRPQSR